MSHLTPTKSRLVEKQKRSGKGSHAKDSSDKDSLSFAPSVSVVHSDVEDYLDSCGLSHHSTATSASDQPISWYGRFYRRLCRMRHALRRVSFLNTPMIGSGAFALHHQSTHRSAVEMLAKRSWTIHQQSLNIQSSSGVPPPRTPLHSKVLHPQTSDRDKSQSSQKSSKKFKRSPTTNDEGLKHLIHSIAETAALANYGPHHSVKALRFSYPYPNNKSQVLKLIQENDGSLRCPNMAGIEDIIDGFKEYEKRFRQENLSPFANVIPKMVLPHSRMNQSSSDRTEQRGMERFNLSQEDMPPIRFSREEPSQRLKTTSFTKSSHSLSISHHNSSESLATDTLSSSLRGSKINRRSLEHKSDGNPAPIKTVSFR